MGETCVLLTLYGVGFVLQVTGAVLVVRDVLDDQRTAQKLAADAEQTKGLTGVRTEHGGGVSTFVGGAAGQALAQTMAATDTFAAFVQARLSGRQPRKLLGVALVLLGAFVGLGGNLVATL